MMSEAIKTVSITIDSRERPSAGYEGIRNGLLRTPGVTLDVSALDAGDFCFGQVLVERKSGGDFAASILDGRLFSQTEKMRALCDKPIYLIEGDPYATVSAIDSVALDGALSWLAVLAGVQVVFSSDARRSVGLIHRMAVHEKYGLGYIPPFRSEKPKLKAVLDRYLVEGLPGVGPQTAMRLLEYFGSPIAVFSASAEQLKAVDGIGATTALKIYGALRGANESR